MASDHEKGVSSLPQEAITRILVSCGNPPLKRLMMLCGGYGVAREDTTYADSRQSSSTEPGNPVKVRD
ncbi:MAG: hypothetical protein NVSMB48_12350 [Marmoricola sp.]